MKALYAPPAPRVDEVHDGRQVLKIDLLHVLVSQELSNSALDATRICEPVYTSESVADGTQMSQPGPNLAKTF
jgi:hypothetical protein